MSGEDWVKSAMADDSMVVELLIHLNDAPPPKRVSPSPPAPPLAWTVRQPRSKQTFYGKKQTERASPTTPLSWSGATSPSGGGAAVADCFEESSRPPTRSEVYFSFSLLLYRQSNFTVAGVISVSSYWWCVSMSSLVSFYIPFFY